MAEVENSVVDSVEEPIDEIELFDTLKRTNHEIDYLLDEMQELSRLKKQIATNSDGDCFSSNLAISASKSVDEQFDLMIQLRIEIAYRMDELELCLKEGDPIPPHKEGSFSKIMDEVLKIHELIPPILEYFHKNEAIVFKEINEQLMDKEISLTLS